MECIRGKTSAGIDAAGLVRGRRGRVQGELAEGFAQGRWPTPATRWSPAAPGFGERCTRAASPQATRYGWMPGICGDATPPGPSDWPMAATRAPCA